MNWLLFMATDDHSHIHGNLEPAQFLVDHVGLLPKGRALDIAMGGGRNAVYLAGLGFTVEGVDISPGAVAIARQLAKDRGVDIQARVADLEKDFQIDTAAYDVIICFYYLQRSLIPQIKAGLKKGGMVVYETFIIDQAQFGHPRNPDFLLQHNELLNMFRDYRCLRYREGIIEEYKAVASIVAQKE
jgi:2-polyprenyl-3-methyl-5-hydroxy-6-metoxy-1,4-benzoquinol methylase